MPKYFRDKIAGCYLYFTSACLIEAVHIHANKDTTVRSGSAKLWFREDGSTVVADRGKLNDVEIKTIQEYVYSNRETIKRKWKDAHPQHSADYYRC